MLDADASFLFQAMTVCSFIMLSAFVLAVLGLRETGKPRPTDEEFAPIPGRGMAILTIVLSSLMVGFPVVSILLVRR